MRKFCYSLLFGGLMAMLAACHGQNRKETTTDSDTIVVSEVKTLERGSVKITWIKDNVGDHLMPLNLFQSVPQDLIDSLGLESGVPSSMSAFWVERDSVQVLFDTGMGGADSRLIPNLKSLGVNPEQVRYLYLTHFHGDHIGGMMHGDSVVFPHAEVYASRVEYEAWMAKPDQDKRLVEKIMTAYQDRLHLFEFNDTLPGRIVALNAAGHTPGHTVFEVGDFLIVGDLVHGVALQMAHPEYCASYDMNPEMAVATRCRILDYARTHHQVMAGMHLPAPAFWSWDK